MRRFLRGLSEVDTALVLGGVTLGAVKLWRRWYMSHHLQASYDTAAQTKVLHAMTGAGIFYRSNNQSYEGVEGGPQLRAGVPAISAIHRVATFVPGDQAPTEPGMVSIYAASESVLVLTAYSNETQTCWGVLSVSRRQARPYFSGFPSTADVGTFRFKGAQNCGAASVVPAALSPSRFPSR